MSVSERAEAGMNGEPAARRRRSGAARALAGDVVQFYEFITVIALSVLIAAIYHQFVRPAELDLQYYAAAGIIGATTLTALLRRDGFYDFERLMARSGALRALTTRWLLVLLGLLAFGFALKISENFSRAWLGAWTVSVLFMLAISRMAIARAVRARAAEDGIFARRVALVGASDLAEAFSANIEAGAPGVSVVGIFEAGEPGCGEARAARVTGDLDALERLARRGEIDDVVFAAPRLRDKDLRRFARRLSNLPISISISPSVHWLRHRGGGLTHVGGVPVLSLYRRPLDGWGSVLKTLEDYVLASLLTVALIPVMAVIALLIRLQGDGPVIFAQRRHGFNNDVFRIYKFRTMTVAEDSDDVRQAKANDPRVTRLGAVLRRYSLDELPQLFNVLRGEMSLVGPRPHALAHNDQYARLIDDYSGRHNVKPGITGWAQVNGYRGETSENELMEERVRYDLAYIDEWSLWFDAKILFMTAAAVLFPRNAV